MADQPRSRIIKDNPINNGLDAFRASFSGKCIAKSIPCTPGAVEQLGHEDIWDLALDLLLALQCLRITRLLRSNGQGKNLLGDMSRLVSAVNSRAVNLDCIKPLLKLALADTLGDALIWNSVYYTVAEAVPLYQDDTGTGTSSLPSSVWGRLWPSFQEETPPSVTITVARFPQGKSLPHLVTPKTTSEGICDAVDRYLFHVPDMRPFWRVPRAWRLRDVARLVMDGQPFHICHGTYVVFYSYALDDLPQNTSFPASFYRN